jgi:DNA (cytosine-5)-methyltransferase 1
MPPLRFIDLFCGIGGFHQAMNRLGHHCVFASDIDAKCRRAYQENYGIEPAGDITQVDAATIPEFDVLLAGFPCQPFSKAGEQLGLDDTRGTLFHHILRIAKHHKPRWLLLENVRNLGSHDGGRTWIVIREAIRAAGYNTYDHPVVANVLHFQVPQFRERVLIFATRADIPLPPKPTLPKNPRAGLTTTLASIVDPNDDTDRPPMTAKYLATRTVWNRFFQVLNGAGIAVPRFPVWTDWWGRDLANLDPTAMASPNLAEPAFYQKYTTWIDHNVTFYTANRATLDPWLTWARETHPEWTGAVRKLEWQGGSVGPKSLDGTLWTLRGSGVRVKQPDYSPTLVAMSMIPVYGPHNKRLSPKELLALQSFAPGFKYDPKAICKQTGNAVNVKMVTWAAEFLTTGVDTLAL